VSTPEIARAITVLHRTPDHLRFALPPALAREPAASHMEQALLKLAGVRRAVVDRGHAKLAVHFDAHTRAVGEIARALLAAAQEATMLPPAPVEGVAAVERPRPGRAVAWLKRKTRAIQQRYRTVALQARTLTAAARGELIRRSPLARVFGPELFNERAILSLLNDIAALYLIKVHWNLITQRWLRAPFAHRYEWLTIIYLTYLFVRFRKQTQKAK
jgi:hypothetical protein